MFQENKQKDFSNFLKAVLEADDPVSAPDPAALAAPAKPVPAYPPVSVKPTPKPVDAQEQSPRNLVKLITSIQERIKNQIEIFETKMSDLDKRFFQKISELSTTVHDDLEQLKNKFKEISDQYEDKSKEVDSILAKVQEMLPTVAGTAKSVLSKIHSGLDKIKTELVMKSKEIEELNQKMASKDSSYQDIQQKLYDLDDYVQNVEEKLEAAKDRIKKLEKEKSRFGTGKFDKAGLEDLEKKEKVPNYDQKSLGLDHTKPYGDFDLMEHLERSQKNAKKNAFDW